jgi:hypothetical protein
MSHFYILRRTARIARIVSSNAQSISSSTRHGQLQYKLARASYSTMDPSNSVSCAKIEPPRAELIRDLGGQNSSTLKSFSLDGNVAVITGGAQGLGLAMAQALFTSGADLAIIDLDRKCHIFSSPHYFHLRLYCR